MTLTVVQTHRPSRVAARLLGCLPFTTRATTTASGAATKLRSAPIFVSARATPAGNAAVAKNRDTVNPIDATTPTTSRSPIRSPGGRLAPARRARVGKEQDPDRLAEEESGEHVIRAWSDLLERHARIRESKQQEDELDGHCPPVFEAVERVGSVFLARIEQPEVTRAVRHERHDRHKRQGRMEPTEVQRRP